MGTINSLNLRNFKVLIVALCGAQKASAKRVSFPLCPCPSLRLFAARYFDLHVHCWTLASPLRFPRILEAQKSAASLARFAHV